MDREEFLRGSYTGEVGERYSWIIHSIYIYFKRHWRCFCVSIEAAKIWMEGYNFL